MSQLHQLSHSVYLFFSASILPFPASDVDLDFRSRVAFLVDSFFEPISSTRFARCSLVCFWCLLLLSRLLPVAWRVTCSISVYDHLFCGALPLQSCTVWRDFPTESRIWDHLPSAPDFLLFFLLRVNTGLEVPLVFRRNYKLIILLCRLIFNGPFRMKIFNKLLVN